MNATLTLASVLDDVGLGMLRVLVAPAGLDVPVRSPIIHDPTDDLAVEDGDIVLAVGVLPDRHDAVDVVRRAAKDGAAAVVLKLRGDPSDALVDAADVAGIAVLAASPEMAWGQLHALLRTAVAASSLREGGPVPIGDLFALANAVASMVGGATTIEDRQSNLLAYSTGDHPIDDVRRQTILGRRVTPEWLDRLGADGVFQRLWTTDDVVRIEYKHLGYVARLAIGVRAGDEILGSIWVAEGERPLGDEAEAALREAGRIAALHLLRHRSGDALERRRRGELLRSALESRVPANVLAATLGMAVDDPVVVIGFELVDAGDGADLEARLERVLDLVTLTCESHRRATTCAAIGRVVYALVPGPGDVRALAEEVIERSGEALHVPVRAGIGRAAAGLADLTRSRSDADAVLRVLGAIGGDAATVDDVRAQVLLHRLHDLAAVEPDLRSGKLQRLLATDDEKGTEYVRTLRAYLDALGDVRVAAASVHVHPNTFRYRLRRLLDVSGLNLDDPVERLITHLQLYL